MYPVPEPMEHQQRMQLAEAIALRLMVRYGASVKAIGLYGSLARNEDGPYSDIEMFCVLREPGETRITVRASTSFSAVQQDDHRYH